MVKKFENKKQKKNKMKPKNKNQIADEIIEDSGIIVIDDNFKTDKNAELEERKAYLEEAKSQDAFD
ncbi:MAG: hypothetical protein OXF28_00540 [Thaumarchaeota archaeon]|nr:hypothetical protein [Nitrososphaerota archaeon]MCY3975609.1 hypothetical protein [Nitrososphaerota archaeon]